MFDIGWSELVVIGVVALIVIGPKELPALLRNLGQIMTKLRRMASEFQGQFQDALREAELDELRKQAEKLSSDVTAAAGNPLEKATSEIQSMIDAPQTPAAPAVEPAAAPTTPADNSPPAGETPKPAESGQPGEGGRAA
jgi:sec-independent protein translocase protein TatB